MRHGHVASPTYASWKAMKDRVRRKRGYEAVTICARWMESFTSFLADMGERPEGLTLDRIDNDGPYEPGNCRWATRSEQQRNKRTTRLTPAGVAWIRGATGLSQQQMASRLGVDPSTISLVRSRRMWV